jgi:hypothetical protein
VGVTGIPGFDWMLGELYAVTGALVVGSAFWRSPGTRAYGVLLAPFVVGLTGIVGLALTFPSETRTFLRSIGDHTASLVVAVIVVLVGAALADFLVARAARRVAGAGVLPDSERVANIACAVTLFIPLMVGFVGLVKLDERTVSGYELMQASEASDIPIEAEHELPGEPMDVSLRSPSEGYISLLDGRIARFILADGGREIAYTIEASGLQLPRGLAVIGNELIVAELGPLPCKPQFPCKGEDVIGASSNIEGERKILRESNARLIRFDIRPDGGLANRRTILDHLPVANSEHALNGVTAGADGRIYVSVGNVDRLATVPLTARERARPNFDLLGVVFSLLPDGTDVRVVARGLRNVYDVAFDEDGRLYGADNDGQTRAGWRREEVLQIRRGAYYGYPFEGTFAPYARPRALPLWVLETVGSAGVEWLRVGKRPTLAVGSCGNVDLVALTESHGAITVDDPGAVSRLLSHLPGCVTAIERTLRNRLLVALFTYDGPPLLYRVRIDG